MNLNVSNLTVIVARLSHPFSECFPAFREDPQMTERCLVYIYIDSDSYSEDTDEPAEFIPAPVVV
jgi:hypothetical protein